MNDDDKTKFHEKYRVTHLLANLGWVDFDLGCSIILPSCSAASAKFPPVQAESGRLWNSQNPSQPNPGSPGDGSPCILKGWPIPQRKSCANIISVNYMMNATNMFVSWAHYITFKIPYFSFLFADRRREKTGISSGNAAVRPHHLLDSQVSDWILRLFHFWHVRNVEWWVGFPAKTICVLGVAVTCSEGFVHGRKLVALLS